MSPTMLKAENERKILLFCKTFKSLREVSERLDMNKNTVRAGYLYPMSKDGRLVRTPPSPAKNAMKYMTAPKR
jgi:hypothetical protein